MCKASAAGERHLDQGDEQAAVGAVVVGEDLAVGRQLLDGREESLQARRLVEIRRHVADLAEDLGQGRAAQAVLAGAEIDEQQLGLAHVRAQLRRERCGECR